jgi:hypothetical protein
MGETMVSGREPESNILDMSQWFSNFDFSFRHYLGYPKKLCLHYDIGYNNRPLVILCRVVYSTLG